MAEGGETNFRELLQRIETALYDAAEVDAAGFLQTLQRAKPLFLNLFRYKASAWDAPGGRLSPFGAVGRECFVPEAPSGSETSPMRSRAIPITIPNHAPPSGGMWAPPPPLSAAAGLVCGAGVPTCLLPACVQEPNAESRAAVQSGKPVLPSGQVVLDPEPDIREVRRTAAAAVCACLLPLWPARGQHLHGVVQLAW